MPLKVNITFTGVCSILRDYYRILLPYANRTRKSCDNVTIPTHHAYIRYRVDQNTKKIPPDEYSPDGKLAVIFLNGDEIGLTGTPSESPERPVDPIDFVAPMERIYPGLQLDPAVLEDPKKLSHAQVTAYFPLDKGHFLAPTPDQSRKWHFFPQRAEPIRMTLAQEVTYQIKLLEDFIGISLRPFGSDSFTEILSLTPADSSHLVTLVIGNTRHEDIFPKNSQKKPTLGPDRHFEFYYKLALQAPCPLPIPNYEGDGTDDMSADQPPPLAETIRFAATRREDGPSVFDAIGGANCPPNQWP